MGTSALFYCSLASLIIFIWLHYVRRLLRYEASKILELPDYQYASEFDFRPEAEIIKLQRSNRSPLTVYRSIAPGPIVLLTHCYGFTSMEWSLVWQDLVQRGFQVVTFDQRAHGEDIGNNENISTGDMARDYALVVEQLDIHDAVLVGHSMGGFVAVRFLLDYPVLARERFKGLVMCASTAGNVLRKAFQNRFQRPLITLGILQWLITWPSLGLLFGASLMGDRPEPDRIKVFNRYFLQHKHLASINIIKALCRENYYPRLHEIDLPAVVICGSHDKTTPAWHSVDLGRQLPNAKNIWVAGKGHMLNWEAPQVIVKAIQQLTQDQPA